MLSIVVVNQRGPEAVSKQESILQIVKQFPNGASVENILSKLVWPLSKRTLQRYLAVLIAEGKLNTSGKARSKLYCFLKEEPAEKQTSGLIPLTAISLSIRTT